MSFHYDATSAIRNWQAGELDVAPATDVASKVFASDVFTLEDIKARIPKPAYKALVSTIERGVTLDASIADVVAVAMKNWALEQGATHYTHWFHPLTNATAEKHDSFLNPDGPHSVVASFSGKELIQAEPDASSFPNGGIRGTSEARGYTGWDPTSPAFILRHANGATLCIPTVFVSWTGEALDTKTPLLRSIEALNKATLKALPLLGTTDVSKVSSTVGAEQEYFLVDEEFYFNRPDLVLAGRTLFGAKPPRGQELEDHYFGSIPNRVLTYMTSVEQQLFALGVPVKTRHNEVAPGQFEIAPTFEESNIAADHQQLIMQVLRTTARRYGMVALLHEKPFAGVNGSGKHCNWSMGTDTGENLLNPGDTPQNNYRFLFFCAAVIRSVHLHQDLLRTSVASAANDHRLGANEAPPAILSVFLGELLTDVLERVASGQGGSSKEAGVLDLGTPVLPKLPKDAGDRNRTSPFAFTGNKFEFRAAGSSQSVSLPITVLNTIVAESVEHLTGLLEAKLAAGASSEAAILEVVKETYNAHSTIVFNGNGYADAWHKEAEHERKLLNLRTSVEAIGTLNNQKNIDLFNKYGVLSQRELEARQEIMFDIYFKQINIEGETTERLAQTQILPAAIDYLAELSHVGVDSKAISRTIDQVAAAVDELSDALEVLKVENAKEGGEEAHHKAHHMRDHVLPAMGGVRAASDKLERLVSSKSWPLPAYSELLFVK